MLMIVCLDTIGRMTTQAINVKTALTLVFPAAEAAILAVKGRMICAERALGAKHGQF